MNSTFWDERFSAPGYTYGTQPNQFFKEQLDLLPPGRILLPGEGEGRNAAYAASCGWDVHAVDWSEAGKKKAEALAASVNASITYSIEDLTLFTPEEAGYDAVALVFIHMEADQREVLHRKALAALKPGGTLILQAYEKEQLGKASGGPQDIALLYSLEDVVTDFIGMQFSVLEKSKTILDEGKFHSGEAFVVNFCGKND